MHEKEGFEQNCIAADGQPSQHAGSVLNPLEAGSIG